MGYCNWSTVSLASPLTFTCGCDNFESFLCILPKFVLHVTTGFQNGYPVAHLPLAPCFCCGPIKLTQRYLTLRMYKSLNHLRTWMYKKHIFMFFKIIGIYIKSLWVYEYQGFPQKNEKASWYLAVRFQRGAQFARGIQFARGAQLVERTVWGVCSPLKF